MAQRGRPKKEKSPEELAKIVNKTPGRRGRPAKTDKPILPEQAKTIETNQVSKDELSKILKEIESQKTETKAPNSGEIKVNVLYDHIIKRKN